MSLGLAACGSPSPALTCVDASLPACTEPAPSFAVLHREVIVPSCAAEGPSCHGVGGRTSDLALHDEDAAFEALAAHLVPSRPECSELAQRVTSDDRTLRMPPAGGLSERDRCAILAWITSGAARD